MSLIDSLKQVRDYRTRPQYPLWVILLLVLMGTMSGCVGYRALEAFVGRHQAQLLELLELDHQRLPSYSTIRRTLVRVDFASLTQVFNDWACSSVVMHETEALAVDGKSIKASLTDYDRAYQDFVSLVSVFSVRHGLVVGLESMHNKDKSEIATVQTLLERLQLSGGCYSLDALHAKKNGAADHCSRQGLPDCC